MSKEITFYAVTHKEVQTKIPKHLVLIGVGTNKNIRGVDIYDNAGGGNISDKNASYCELTALYWIWKNDDSHIIGFEHYRRFFLRYGRYLTIFLSPKAAQRKLKKYDVILPKRRKLPGLHRECDYNVYQQYDSLFHIKDLDCCREVVKEKYPDYASTFDMFMEQHDMSCCNMFIMGRGLVDSYCQWLFDILFEVEKRTDISEYDDYQKRVYGFLAERLLNIWVIKNKLKIYQAVETNVELRSGVWKKIKGLFG